MSRQFITVNVGACGHRPKTINLTYLMDHHGEQG